jgi:hypothetical protein
MSGKDPKRPRASRPKLPGYGLVGETEGEGLLPWSWAADRLTAARNYFIATTRPDGTAVEVTDPALLEPFARAYQEKYAWDVSGNREPVYVVRPRVVYGQIEKTFTKSATRWQFD